MSCLFPTSFNSVSTLSRWPVNSNSANASLRSDIVRFGKQHARGGKLAFTQHKGRNRKPKRLTLPILPALQQVIDGTAWGDLTFLVNDWSRPFTDAGFGNKFRDWCDRNSSNFEGEIPRYIAASTRERPRARDRPDGGEGGRARHVINGCFAWRKSAGPTFVAARPMLATGG
jgi:hypothetical protein